MKKDDIEQLEENIRNLKSQDNFIDALTNLEKLITIKAERFGKKSEEVEIIFK
jgi:hypothetical protein